MFAETPDPKPCLTYIGQSNRSAMQRRVLDADVDGETLWVATAGATDTCTMSAVATQRNFQGSYRSTF